MRLIDYLKQSGLTQRDFAEISGVATSTLNNWVKGHRTPNLQNVLLIQSVTGNRVTIGDWIETLPDFEHSQPADDIR